MHFDLIVIGTGSGNSLIGPEMDTWKIAIVERGVFGGTCLNRGCIPSKMLIYTADVAQSARRGTRFGVDTRVGGVDWPAIRDRVFGRIDPIAEGGRQYRHSLPNVTVFEGDGHFVGERAVEVGGQTITADQVVIATGARPHIPRIPGLDPSLGDVVPYLTSDDIMRIDALPERLIVLGGGFIAAELGHVFAALGSAVTIVNRSELLLRAEDHDIAARYTQVAAHQFDLVMGVELRSVESVDGEIRVHVTRCAISADDPGEPVVVSGDALLVATGRIPNGDQIDAAAAGVQLHAHAVQVDQYGRTSAPGVWALGDVDGRYQLKHMANGEAKVVRHNLTHPDELRPFDTRPAPHAVFGDPSIGAVGLTGHQARQLYGDDALAVVTHDYAAAAFGWALEDHDGFVKLIGHRPTRLLLGAHIIGYHAPTIVQLLVQGMHLGNTVDQLATGQIWIHPALPEVVEQALLKLVDAFDNR